MTLAPEIEHIGRPPEADSQAAAVLDHLRRGESITQEDARRLYGIGRLAARVEELRRAGWVIDTHREQVTKADGSVAVVGRYTLRRSG